MTQTNIRRSSRIARLAVNQGARPVVPAQAAVDEKSTTEPDKKTKNKMNTNLLKCKRTTNISPFNVRTLNSNSQISELVSSAIINNIGVICIQEHRYYHEELNLKYHEVGKYWTLITASACKNSMNSTIGGVGMLVSPHALKSLNSIEKISSRIIIATFNGNPKTTVICCYSPTNISEETEVEDFYNDLSSLSRDVPKHNVLIVGGDMNAQLGSSKDNKHTYHNKTNRNGKLLNDFAIENRLMCLNTNFQKKAGKRWTHTYPTGDKAQLDYLFINNKWKNSVLNCEAYNTFVGVKSDHRIVTAKVRLSLRKNIKKTSIPTHYDWSTIATNEDIRYRFTVSVRNKYEALCLETNTNSPNIKYNNLVLSNEQAAADCIPLKPKIKKRVPWESIAVIAKRKELQKSAEMKNSLPTNKKKRKFKSLQKELTEIYEAEQTDYIQNKISIINEAAVNKKSSIAWQTVNEISRRKGTSKAKLKAENQNERLKKWKNHFQSLLGSTPSISDEPIKYIINYTLNIKTGNFDLEELNKVVMTLQSNKATGPDNIPTEFWKSGEFNDILLELCNEVYNQNHIDRWREGCILPFPKKGDLGDAKNYRGITLTTISAKIYNKMLLNRIQPELERILRKNQNGFRKNRSTEGQILTVRRIIEGVKARNLPAVLLFVDFSKAFDSIHRGKMEEILKAYGIPDETVTAIMMLYKNTRARVKSPDGDTEYFDVVAGVLQGDTLAPYLFIICLDYVLRASIDSNKELGFTLVKARSRRYPEMTIADADYADDIALMSNTVSQAEKLLHHVENAAKEIGLYINAEKTEHVSYNQAGSITSLCGELIKSVSEFKYLGSNIASTERDVII